MINQPLLAMNKPLLSLAASCGLMLSVVPAGVAAPQDYQVTGPIISMTDTTVTIEKKKGDDWEIGRNAALKPADGSELKVGDQVTIHYTMAAKSVEKKMPAKREKQPPKDKGTPAAPAASASPAKP